MSIQNRYTGTDGQVGARWSKEFIKLLLKYGANIELTKIGALPALEFAKQENKDVLRLLANEIDKVNFEKNVKVIFDFFLNNSLDVIYYNIF